jgi:hypothetical protein
LQLADGIESGLYDGLDAIFGASVFPLGNATGSLASISDLPCAFQGWKFSGPQSQSAVVRLHSPDDINPEAIVYSAITATVSGNLLYAVDIDRPKDAAFSGMGLSNTAGVSLIQVPPPCRQEGKANR